LSALVGAQAARHMLARPVHIAQIEPMRHQRVLLPLLELARHHAARRRAPPVRHAAGRRVGRIAIYEGRVRRGRGRGAGRAVGGRAVVGGARGVWIGQWPLLATKRKQNRKLLGVYDKVAHVINEKFMKNDIQN